MIRVHSLAALSTLLALSGATVSLPIYGNVCVYKPPTVHSVQGRIMDRSGWPIPAAQVSVIGGTKTLQTIITNDAGEFRFDPLEDGKYEIDVTARGFQHDRYVVNLSSRKSPKQVLEITLGIGSIYCQGSIVVVEEKPKSH